MLSTPPAFVLSQDQTLHRNRFGHRNGRAMLKSRPRIPHKGTRPTGTRTDSNFCPFYYFSKCLLLLYGLTSFSDASLIRSWLPLFCFQGATLLISTVVPSGAGCYSTTSFEAQIHTRRSVCDAGSSGRSALKRGHTLIDFRKSCQEVFLKSTIWS